MKSTIRKLTPLWLALLLVSCNEKVSPKLQNSDSSTTVPPTVVPTEYYFEVTNASSTLLNYQLHKTGSSNYGADCKISGTTAFSSDLYRADPSTYDITCYFDAEELSLFNTGMSFAFSSSQNTCEYVGYAPFSFFERQAGDSSSNLTQITCSGDANNADANAQTPSNSEYGVNQTLDCDEFVDRSIAEADRLPFNASNDAELCRFNHSDGDQCDIGVINITLIDVNETSGVVTTDTSTRTVYCGGAIANCINGPIRELDTEHTRITEIYETTLNENFSEQIDLPNLVDQDRVSNRKYVNYRRNLASTQIDFIASADGGYAASFADTTYSKIYEPSLMDLYSINKKMDGTALISTTDYDAETIRRGFTARPYSAEPFMGLQSSYRTNPFYTFYCFDSAFDVRARIRMVVRDWDRLFTPGANIEYLSDIFLGTSARQDIPGEVEVDDDGDPWNSFNDLGDWDDFIPMTRTSGTYNSSTTIWEPTTGFFDASNFSNDNEL